MNKFLLLVVITVLVSTSYISAQNIAINENGDPAHSSALLDVQSANKGLLAPRLTTLARTNIDPTATGLIVFDTDEKDYFFYDGTDWIAFGKVNDAWEKSGVDITNVNTGNISVGSGTAEQKIPRLWKYENNGHWE